MSTQKLPSTSTITMPTSWRNGPIRVALVGAGGTGSQLLGGLARLHVAMRSLGHPRGLEVGVWDGDNVSAANIGRQMFSRGDIGRNKAVVLVNRINAFFGLDWEARPERYGATGYLVPHIIITCVDTASARREIAKAYSSSRYQSQAPMWLDCGNSQKSGQVMLGGFSSAQGLPQMRQLLPEIFDESIPEDNRPSCSLAEALASQDLFINQAIATWGLQLLWTLIREGELSVCGYWINLEEGRVAPVPVPAPRGKKGGKS